MCLSVCSCAGAAAAALSAWFPASPWTVPSSTSCPGSAGSSLGPPTCASCWSSSDWLPGCPCPPHTPRPLSREKNNNKKKQPCPPASYCHFGANYCPRPPGVASSNRLSSSSPWCLARTLDPRWGFSLFFFLPFFLSRGRELVKYFSLRVIGGVVGGASGVGRGLSCCVCLHVAAAVAV